MITEQNPTIAEAIAFVIAQIQQDVAHGLYEQAPQLDCFAVLHDYCDANEYIIEASKKFCPLPEDALDEQGYLLLHGWQDEVCDAVDTLLNEQPITV